MTSPTHAKSSPTGRYYEHPLTAERATSVTKCCGVLNKPALVNWAAKLVATYAVEHLNEWFRLGKSQATDLLKGEPNRVMRASGDLGSLVHGAVEAKVIGGPILPAVEEVCRAHLEHFAQFCADFEPVFICCEATLWSRQHGYAGTTDAFVSFNRPPAGLTAGDVVVLDYKTGSGVYPEAALQMSAYRYADFILLADGTEIPVPEVTAGAVLHLRPEGYQLVPVDTGPEVFELFLHCLALCEWVDGLSKRVIGPALCPPVLS